MSGLVLKGGGAGSSGGSLPSCIPGRAARRAWAPSCGVSGIPEIARVLRLGPAAATFLASRDMCRAPETWLSWVETQEGSEYCLQPASRNQAGPKGRSQGSWPFLGRGGTSFLRIRLAGLVSRVHADPLPPAHYTAQVRMLRAAMLPQPHPRPLRAAPSGTQTWLQGPWSALPSWPRALGQSM